MPKNRVEFLKSTEATADLVFAKLGNQLRIAAPLGLGKPCFLLNEIYDRVAKDPGKRLDLFTALSLTPPSVREELGRRFFEPFRDRHFGKDYPVLHYALAATKDRLPPNVRVHEFYLQSGSALNSKRLQRDYQSVNYTHVPASVLRENVQAIVQLVAKRGERYSLSCNPDLTFDVDELYRAGGRPLFKIAVVHPDLPYLEGESEVDADFFDAIVDAGAAGRHELFALPHEPIADADHMIGLWSSALVVDGGTIQVGIGSLSEAIGAALVLREKDNGKYSALIQDLRGIGAWPTTLIVAETARFEAGLYGLSEMVTDVFMHLRRAGVLKREVIDEVSGGRAFLHGAFYLGSKEFYRWLRELPPSEMMGVRMTRVSKVNDLYDPNEVLLRRQRVGARFFNTCMQMSLLGEAMSETLDDGRVVSGIGGQYNFVAMSQELQGARSVLMLRSTYQAEGRVRSNIVWTPGHVSIPRHLRDVVVTEYGIADVRGHSDEDTIRALLGITDSRFQAELLVAAKRAGKIDSQYRIPEEQSRNTPKNIKQFCDAHRDYFRAFPFGSDFTPVEERLALALQSIRGDAKMSKARVLWRGFRQGGGKGSEAELERMGLLKASGFSERLNRRILRAYLN